MGILEQVKNLSNETGMILHCVMNRSFSLLENNSTFHDSLLLNISYQLLSSTQDHSSDVPDLLASIDIAKMQELYLARNNAKLNDMVTQLSLAVVSLNRATDYTMSEVNQTLSRISNHITAVQDVSTKLRFVLPAFLSATSAVLADLNDTQAVSIGYEKNNILC